MYIHAIPQVKCISQPGRMSVAGEEIRLRQKTHRVDYKEISDVKLPKAQRTKRRAVDRLYPVEIVDEDTHRYKVHYVGYSDTYDEWKPKELVPLEAEQTEGGSDEEESVNEESSVNTIQRFPCTKNFQELRRRLMLTGRRLQLLKSIRPLIALSLMADYVFVDKRRGVFVVFNVTVSLNFKT